MQFLQIEIQDTDARLQSRHRQIRAVYDGDAAIVIGVLAVYRLVSFLSSEVSAGGLKVVVVGDVRLQLLERTGMVGDDDVFKAPALRQVALHALVVLGLLLFEGER